MKGTIIYFVFVSLLAIFGEFSHFLWSLGLLLLLILFLAVFKSFSGRAILLVLGIFLIFSFRAHVEHKAMNYTDLNGKESRFHLVFDELKIDGNKLSTFAKDQNHKDKLAISYYIPSEREQQILKEYFVPGMECTVVGTLEKPSPPSNENAFSYLNYLKAKKIQWILEINQIELNSCKKSHNNPLTTLKRIRYYGVQYLEENFPKETSTLATALIFGNRNFLDQQLIDVYQDLGITHLLAISGLNVSMLVGIIFYLGIRLGVTRESMTNWLLICLPIYMILTGASPSVNRACMMMFMILLLSKWQYRVLNILDLISMAFLFYVFWSPAVIFDVGFQLSFCVTFALILSSVWILKFVRQPLILLLMVSLISQLAAAPIILYNFYEISIISLFANLLFVPLFSAVLSPIAMLLFIFHLFLHNLLIPAIIMFNYLIILTNTLTIKLGQIPFATIVLGRPSIFQLFLYIFGTLLFFVLWERRRGGKNFLNALLIPSLVFILDGASPLISAQGAITFIDIGQGDSILIQLPYHKGTYLIDTGGTMTFSIEEWKKRKSSYEVGSDTLVPFLKSKGIASIDKLILTHGDMDHMGGSFSLMKEIKVRELVLPKTWEHSPLEDRLVEQAKKRGIPIKVVQDGDQWVSSNTSFFILSPNGTGHVEKNDGSIVLYTKLGGLSWLFTGDLEESGEAGLIQRYSHLPLDVLKVGHHGSKTSTSELLLNSYHPKIAIISVGRENRFGHPHSDVLNRLSERNILIFRTDLNGAVSYHYHGKEDGTFSTIIP
ncbi:DNA internalization-related competence protein ComEC/Rec2 [Cytobacillus sp. Hz8]|uniref:DNA internalization-related competence protein ComEC/Rec2 n=1 Tax=Cytobacillus sp. Hz8 TaxID=3347168 RepID=UPI0035E0F4D5